MKIRTKLAIAFLTITVVPITLIYMAIIGLNNYQARVFSEDVYKRQGSGRAWGHGGSLP